MSPSHVAHCLSILLPICYLPLFLSQLHASCYSRTYQNINLISRRMTRDTWIHLCLLLFECPLSTLRYSCTCHIPRQSLVVGSPFSLWSTCHFRVQLLATDGSTRSSRLYRTYSSPYSTALSQLPFLAIWGSPCAPKQNHLVLRSNNPCRGYVSNCAFLQCDPLNWVSQATM